MYTVARSRYEGMSVSEFHVDLLEDGSIEPSSIKLREALGPDNTDGTTVFTAYSQSLVLFTASAAFGKPCDFSLQTRPTSCREYVTFGGTTAVVGWVRRRSTSSGKGKSVDQGSPTVSELSWPCLSARRERDLNVEAGGYYLSTPQFSGTRRAVFGY